MKREYNVSLPLLSLCIVSSAFGVTEQAEAKLVPLHSTPGKGQCRAESQFGGAPKDSKVPSLVAGLACEFTPFLRRTPVLTLSALTPFC